VSAPAAVWVQAARPRTLPAAVVPVVVGTAAFAAVGARPHWGCFAACLGGALAIQIGCNFANDAFDHLKGADTAERVGPRRAVAAGLISARAMLLAAAIALAIAFAFGMYLTAVAGWPILAAGVASIACAVLYTGGPVPLAYLGMGDIFVFIFFGLVAVVGSADVQAMELVRRHEIEVASPWAMASALLHNEWLVALACGIGLQCTTILVVNNLRDLDTDAKSGKRTLAVLFGPRLTRWYYAALHLGATLGFVRVAQEPRLDQHRYLWLAPAAAALGGLILSVLVARARGKQLNPLLARSAMLELLTGALLVIGLSI
jgi:1,4-dihydroxy-2-naphthoate octaprenyltransferase